MKKQFLFSIFILTTQIVYPLNFEKNGKVFTTINSCNYLPFSPSYPVLITTGGHEEALMGPGRKIISADDTIAVIFAEKNMDPNFDMFLYQSYSTDNGNNWNVNGIGHNWSRRIKTDIDQCINHDYPFYTFSLNHFLSFNEMDTLFFSYDDLPPFALYNLISVDTEKNPYIIFIVPLAKLTSTAKSIAPSFLSRSPVISSIPSTISLNLSSGIIATMVLL